MSAERDDLVQIIDDRWHGYGYNPQGAAAAILAAGYTKHGAELDAAKRAAKTLNEVIEKQCREVLDVTGLHHLINEDGDGAWDVVWMRLHEMREELKDLKESTIARERKRGDAWRDRAQEMDSRAQSLEVELQNAKPQQVTTAVELAALPRFTVIRSADGTVLERQTMWHEAGSRALIAWPDIPLPVTVLQLGWGEE
jgi:hypothetical protein